MPSAHRYTQVSSSSLLFLQAGYSSSQTFLSRLTTAGESPLAIEVLVVRFPAGPDLGCYILVVGGYGRR